MTELFTIKPLEWEQNISGLRAVVGVYIISVFRTFNAKEDDQWYWTAGDKKCQPCASPEEGKRLAEEHWQAYIKQALEPAKEQQ